MKQHAFRKTVMVLAAVACSAVSSTTAHAHDTWAVMQDYTLVKPAAPMLNVVSSHLFSFPAKDLVTTDRVASVLFIAPDGTETRGVPAGKDGFRAQHDLKSPGTHLSVVVSPAGFSTKTTEGYKQGKSKKDVDNVISCNYSEKFSKALFTVGKAGGNTFSRTLGHSLEIVPLQDPSAMKVGEVMSVRVLFQGKPLPSATVSGVYAGFSNDPGTFAYSTTTNKEGIAKVKLIHNGPWLLLVKQKSAYPDMTVCDAKSYSSALTFSVR
ncbi:DUF4198 domain-containing protein [Pelobacter propionicus]|uniref:ABC-type Co2+ transport system periplasmic component-like protein n=1 Tax=Pelobacter propionicus (strain DSM 2379 / NBRC 103807 / OttBd1) TaxID=338966 RepID=A1ANE7_PELPD|nr:DUF4198 domain-containing protein [Pelobacter propionicus]ABK98867.1 ABC-type Co2+ transport system periplasmic component-like protein [Pelobacter propionicus DSM 2379]